MRMHRVLILSWIRNLRHPWLRGSSIQHVMITVWIRAVSSAGVTMACMYCRLWETRSAGESDRKLIKHRCFLVIQRKIYLNHGEHHNHMAKKRPWNHWRFVFTVGRHCRAGTMPTQAWEGSVTWEVKVTGSGVISLRQEYVFMARPSQLPALSYPPALLRSRTLLTTSTWAVWMAELHREHTDTCLSGCRHRARTSRLSRELAEARTDSLGQNMCSLLIVCQ